MKSNISKYYVHHSGHFKRKLEKNLNIFLLNARPSMLQAYIYFHRHKCFHFTQITNATPTLFSKQFRVVVEFGLHCPENLKSRKLTVMLPSRVFFICVMRSS